MWPFKKKETKGTPIDPAVATAIILSVISLAFSIGCARWGWLMLDEQIKIRSAFTALENHEKQTDLQYEYWLNKVQQERAAMRNDAGQQPPVPQPPTMMPKR